jgi:4-hydroxy-tetrahydrodipicolinate reductase
MSTPPTTSSSVRIIVSGAAGRMGARLCALARADPALALVGAIERGGAPSIGEPAAPGAVKIAESTAFSAGFQAHAVIDFSSDDGAHDASRLARRLRAALLVGTTALSRETLDALRAASADIPVLVAANTSAGVAAAAALTRSAAAILGPAFDCSIVEAHHNAKKDAPSGTALRLADAARDGGARLDTSNIVSIRGGDVVGEHTVRFAAPGEYLEITHRATSRDLFARGALAAAVWLARQKPGWWTMNDVLGLPAR